MISILVGANRFAVLSAVSDISSDFVKKYGDLALERLDGEEHSAQQIKDAIETIPFLAEKKLVVAKNLSACSEIAENIEDLLTNVPDSTDLVIVEFAVDKRTAYYKHLKKLPNFNEFSELSDQDMIGWLKSLAEKRGVKINPSEARYLTERVGLSQQRLAQELDKLVLYGKPITKAVIDELVEPTLETSIFQLLDIAFSGNHKKAVGEYLKQTEQNVDPHYIFSMIVWQVELMAIAKIAKGKTAGEIAKDLGVGPYAVEKSIRLANSRTKAEIHELIDKLVEIDTKAKTISFNLDLAIRTLLIDL